MQYLTQNQFERIKKNAKKELKTLSKEVDVTHLNILDREARLLGYSNWNSLQKFHLINKSDFSPKFIRTPEKMKESFKKIRNPQGVYRRRDEEDHIRQNIEDIHEKYQCPLSALVYARDFLRCALQVKRWSVHGLSLAYSEMRIFLPYCLESVGQGKYVLVGRDYTPVGMKERKLVNYSNYENLHLSLTEEDLNFIGGNYFYNDGLTPWDKRKNAQIHLSKIEKLIDILMRKK